MMSHLLAGWRAALVAVAMLLAMATPAQAQVVRGDVGGGEMQMVPPPPDEDPPYNYANFSAQSVPASMVAGGVYTVTVSMVNTGTTTWAPGAYFLGSQNPQDNGTWGGSRASLAGYVGPNQTAVFSFQVTAPATPGTYNFQWKMVQEYVEWFGAYSPNVAIM